MDIPTSVILFAGILMGIFLPLETKIKLARYGMSDTSRIEINPLMRAQLIAYKHLTARLVNVQI